MINYRWVCHLCEAVNTPASSICEKCNFPAIASRNDMDRALENSLLKTNPHKDTFKQLSLPKILAIGFAITALIVGTTLAKFASPIWLNVVGLLLTGVAALVLWTMR